MDNLPTPDRALQPDITAYPRLSTFKRIASYGLVRAITLFCAVVIGLYLTILVANLGGYVDRIFEGMINDTVLGMIRGGMLKEVPEDQREARIEEITWQLEEEYGLHEPFLQRTWNWLVHGLTLDFGQTRYNYTGKLLFASEDEQNIGYLISLALPYTLVLVGGANLLVFFLSLG